MKRETVYLLARGCASCDPESRLLLKYLHTELRNTSLLGDVRVIVLEPGNTLYGKIVSTKVSHPFVWFHDRAYYQSELLYLMDEIKKSVKVS